MDDAVVDLKNRPEPMDCIEIWESPVRPGLELDEVLAVQEILEDEFEGARMAPLSAVYDAVAYRKIPGLTLERLNTVMRAMGYRILAVVGTDLGHALAPAASAA